VWIYVVLALPLLFIRVSNSHDWGDDFAQYLLQAQYISGNLNELPVKATSGHGPEMKGVFFSALLVPVTLFFDVHEIMAGKILVSLTLILFGFAVWQLFKVRFGDFNALILALCLIYNFQFLRIKDQILPDFLFGAIIIFSFLLLTSRNRNSIYVGLILAAITTAVKSAGIAVVMTAAIMLLSNKIHYIKTLREKIKAMSFMAITLLTIFMIEVWLSGSKPSLIWYTRTTVMGAGLSMISENWFAYKKGLSGFFEFEVPMMFNVVFKWMFELIFAAGLLYRIMLRREWPEIFISIYIIFLLLYPYNHDPVRFLLPVVPLVVLITLESLFLLIDRLKVPMAHTLTPLVFGLLTVQTARLELQRKIEYPTESRASVELIEFLSAHIPPGELVADTKPWTIAYLTGIRAVPFNAAYLSDYRIIRTQGIDLFSDPLAMTDKVVFKNTEFTVISNKDN
jgi:hypothetical protein